jgi:hypothetical protein
VKDPEEKPEEAGSRQGSAASARSHDSMDSQMEHTMHNLSLVAQQMSHSTRNILRAFCASPVTITLVQGRLAFWWFCCYSSTVPVFPRFFLPNELE